jgi:hypothetical protein
MASRCPKIRYRIIAILLTGTSLCVCLQEATTVPPLSVADEAVQSMVSRWAASPGSHPLCHSATLRSEVALAQALPARPRSTPRRAAAVTLLGRLPPSRKDGGAPEYLTKPRYNSNETSTRPHDSLFLDFLSYANTFDEHFLAPLGIDYVVLYQSRAGLGCDIAAIFDKLGWIRSAPTNSTSERLTTLAGVTCGSGDFRTSLGTLVMLRARPLPFPRYIQAEPARLRDHKWGSCAGSWWTPDYRLYAGAAYASHVLVDPVLAPYDITFKIDADIEFFTRPPQNPVAVMEHQGCVWAQSAIRKPGAGAGGKDCHDGALEALERFNKEAGLPPPPSGRHEWCSHPFIFYGNFVAYASEYLRSPLNVILATWFYECHDGYFRARWGDQTPMAMFLCQHEDIEDVYNASSICDFSKWRGRSNLTPGAVFMHH